MFPGFVRRSLVRALHARGWRKAEGSPRRGAPPPPTFADQAEARSLRRLFEALEVDLVLDIGGNRGGFGRLARRLAGYQGRIISYEPAPDLAEKLRARVDPLWTVEARALAETPGPRRLNLMAQHVFNSFGTPRPQSDGEALPGNRVTGEVEVDCVTLAQALEAAGPCRAPYLKLDTQGWDLRILRSGREVLPKFVALQTELSMRPVYEESEDFREAYAFLTEAGFALHALTPVNDLQHMALKEVNGIFVRADLT